MNKIKYLLAVLLCLPAASMAQAPVETLTVRVVGESGEPLVGALISTGDTEILSDANGRAMLDLTPRKPITLRIAADGHYPMLHTVVAEDARIADIQLVRHATGRRLLLFAGDAMLSRRFFQPRAGERILIRNESIIEDGRKVLQFVRPYVQLAELASVNLETALSAKVLSNPLSKSVTFWSPAEFAELLEWTGFDYTALGNNHLYDFRDAGLRETFKALSKTGLGYSGAGLNESGARAPFRTPDGELTFLSYVGWPGNFAPTQTAAGNKGGSALGTGDVFVEDLARIDPESISILQQHRGIEYADRPALTERTDLRRAIDAGADLAIAHHPHVLQGLEIYKDRLVAYSMGNFLFDQYIYSTQAGMLLYVWLDGQRLHRAEVVPLNINGYVPTPATGAFRFALLNRLARLSRELGTCMRQSGAHAVLGAGVDCPGSELVVPDDDVGGLPLALWSAGVEATNPLRVRTDGRPYRLGTDLLPRGDFESAGLFGTPVRAWLLGEQAEIDATETGKQLTVTVESKQRVRSGMKVFERAFGRSAPATLSGIVATDAPLTVRFFMQRRGNDQGLADALASGPLTEIGSLSLASGETRQFAVDHQLPRLATKSIRLIVEVENPATAGPSATARFDDLAWVEWQTPWLNEGDAEAEMGTHLQLQN